MMAIEWLFEPTVALTGALLAVLLLRPLARRRFGAAAAYGLWTLVPASLVGVLLPAAAEPVLPVLVQVAPMTASADAAPAMDAALGSRFWLAWLWAAGAMGVLAWLVVQQQRFLAGLGPVTRRPDGLHQCLATRGLPAVLGLRPRIVLPGDFDQRYDPIERELVLAHEAEHLRRGDLLACLMAAALRVLFWFNPLVHLAAVRFRNDQELACDAAVLRRYPGQRRRYGDAMLKTRLADQPLPLGCHWSGFHPMKERLAMLKNPPPSRRRRFAGLFLAFSTALATGAVTWAAQPTVASATSVAAQTTLKSEAMTVRAAALRIAADAGMRIENPGALDATRLVKIDFDDIPVAAAFELLGSEDGLMPRITGDTVRFEPVADDPGGMRVAGIEGPAPEYPKAAADAGQGGMVMLDVLVGADGKAEAVRFVPEKSTVDADSAIVANAIKAAGSWKFQPATKDGLPVKHRVLVPVRFDPPLKAPEA